MKRSPVPMLVVSAVLVMASLAFAVSPEGTPDSSSGIPLTTSSETARRAFQGGLENIEH